LEATIYYLNLTNPFNTKSDFMNLLSNMSVAGGSASIAPNYVDGTMFANDNEFYLYGLASLISSSDKSLILRFFVAEACFLTPGAPILLLRIKSSPTLRTSMAPIEARGRPTGNKNTYPLMSHDTSRMVLPHRLRVKT
jgi:hypothetical protein